MGYGTMEVQSLLEKMLDEEREGGYTLASSFPLFSASHWCLPWPNLAGSQSTLEPETGGLQVSLCYPEQSRD